MPRTGFSSPTIPDATYNLARQQAEREGISTSELIAKAIRRYVNFRQEREETAMIVLETMERIERTRSESPNQETRPNS